jgi:hypothetical protein
MLVPRRITANLVRVAAVREETSCGVALEFTPTSRNAKDVDRVDEFADLGPELTLESSHGLATILRLLKAARLTAPRPLESWLGQPELAAERLDNARGGAFALEIVGRTRMRFTAWTEEDTVEISNVADVQSDAEAFLVRRVGHRMPVRIPREVVVRHETDHERWFEITTIERA